MVNENAVEYCNGKWLINKSTINSLQIPISIVDILVKKVIELDEEQRVLLSYASAIGRQFDIELLFEIADLSKEKIIQIIDRSVNEQFLEKNFYKHGDILFIHDRVMDAFYKNIGIEKRKKLHNKIGRIIESRNAHNIQNVIFDLAYHFVESGDTDKALEYVYSAALKSMENFASEEAVRYFLLTAKYLEEKGAQGGEQWIECIKNAGNINIFSGKLVEAQELFQRLLPFSKSSDLKAEIYHSIGMVYFNASQHDKAADYMKNALKILGEDIPGNRLLVFIGFIKELVLHGLYQNSTHLQIGKKNDLKTKQMNLLKISILDNLGWLYLSTNTLYYIYIKVKTVNICQRQIGYSRELIRSLANVGFIFGIMRLFKIAFKYFENALTISKELKSEISYCDVNLPWGYTLQWKGNYEESTKKLLDVVTINKKNGSYIDLITSYHAYISTLLIWGELNLAKKNLDDFLIYSRRLDGTYVKSLTAFLNAWYNIVKGNKDLALAAALESYTIASGKELLLECVECAIIARIYLLKGDLEKGFEFIERAKKINETNKFLYMYTNFLYVVWAELHLAKYVQDISVLTKESAAVYKKKLSEVFRTAYTKTKNLPHFVGNFQCVKAKYFAAIGKYKEAEYHFRKSLEICSRYTLKFDLAVSYYDFGLFLQKNSRYDEARKHIEKSYGFFKEMSSVHYLKMCEEFLGLSGKESTDSTERFSQLVKISQRMSSLVLVSQKISSILDLDELLNKIMESVLELAGAQNAVLMMVDKKTGILKKVVSKSADNTVLHDVHFSDNIIQQVYKTGKAIISTNAMEDDRYSSLHSVVINKTKSVLCMPIKYNDEIRGVCYLDNQLSSSVFSEEDIEILNVFMTQVAISIENAELYRLAITDGLTDLFTHKHFKSLLDREVNRSRRFNRFISLLMFDIDHFKRFNDNYGHQAGDFVLMHVSKILKESFRTIDVVARYGGEEFAVILPETGINGALIAAERLRLAIEQEVFLYNDMKLKVTISIGISIFPDHAQDSTLMITAADKALYKSKENGRNQITVYQPE